MSYAPEPGFGYEPSTSQYDLIPSMQSSTNMKYVSVSVLTVVLWDILTTYSQEVKHVYPSRISLVKVLWFMNRILVPVNIIVHIIIAFMRFPSEKMCSNAWQFMDWMGSINLFVVQAALSLRVVAIYQHSPLVVASVTLMLLGATASRVALMAISPITHMTFTVKGVIIGCDPFPLPSASEAFLGPLILDTVLFFMTVWRLRYKIDPYGYLPGSGSLYNLLFRDGTIYFLVVAVTVALNITGFYDCPLLEAFSESNLFLGIISICCSRMILNLRETVSRASLPPNTASSIPTNYVDMSERS